MSEQSQAWKDLAIKTIGETGIGCVEAVRRWTDNELAVWAHQEIAYAKASGEWDGITEDMRNWADPALAWKRYAFNNWSDDAMGWDEDTLGKYAWAEMVAFIEDSLDEHIEDIHLQKQLLDLTDCGDISSVMVEWAYSYAVKCNLPADWSIE